ncbi:MAG TPA: TorF family putative porin [Gammaproteobacteria bacterium]|nr:TorF family putative porin [Gammaproteobacteria bacterium]
MTTWLPLKQTAAAAVLLLPAATAQAQQPDEFLGGTFGGNLTLGTDYMFRGLSQTHNKPQLQGSLSWSHSSGLYLGVWSTNTNFGDSEAHIELDPYIGFAGSIGDSDFSYDVGYWYYTYPGSNIDYDFGELYGNLTYTLGDLSLTGSLWYSDNYFGKDFFDGVSSLAYHGVVAYQLPMGFSVSGRVGEQTFDENSGLPNQDYQYYDAGISANWKGFTADLRWYDTTGVEPQLSVKEDADGRWVFSVTRSF